MNNWRSHTAGNPAKTRRNKFRQGLASLEFALIAPVFFFIFIGIVEMSLMMLAQHLIENATYNASRLAKTGYVAAGKSQIDTVIGILQTELGSLAPLINLGKVSFSSTSYGKLSDIGQPGEGSTGLGTSSEVVVITVKYPWKFFTPMIGDIMGDENDIINLQSRIVVRNEPYT